VGLALAGVVFVLVVLAADRGGRTLGPARATASGPVEAAVGPRMEAHLPGTSWALRAPRDSSCQVVERSRSYLRLAEGRYAYVEPHVLLPDGSGFLIAGQPTYTATVDATGRGSMEDGDRFLGLRVDRDRVRVIDLPPGGRDIGWSRGVALGSSRWRLLFDRLEPGGVPGDAPVDVAYGELDDGTWAHVESIPTLLESPSLGVVAASLLETEAPAFTIVSHRQGAARDVVLWRREGGLWGSRVVSERWVDEVGARAWQGRVRIVLSGLDPAFEPKRASVRMFDLPLAEPKQSEQPHPKPRRLAVAPESGRFYQPILVGGTRLDVGWLAARAGVPTSAWIAVDALSGGAPSPVLLEERAALLAGLLWGDGSLWIVHGAGHDSASGRLTLFIVQGADPESGIRSAGSIPYPFVGPFSALKLATGEIVVVGAEVDFRPTSQFVRSLVLRLGIQCT
jgi:hypothetical protein